MALARSALLSLESALQLFEDVSQNPGALKVLVRIKEFLNLLDVILILFSPCCGNKANAPLQPCLSYRRIPSR